MNKSLGTHTLPALGEGQPGAAHLLGLSEEESVRLEDPYPHAQQVAPALYNVLGLRLQGGCHTRGN